MSKRLRVLRSDLISRVALISLAAGALVGCSGAVERFGEAQPIYTGSTNNQRQILSGGGSQPSYNDIINGSGGTVAGLPPQSSAPRSTVSRSPVTRSPAPLTTASIPNNGPGANVGAQQVRQPSFQQVTSRPLAAPSRVPAARVPDASVRTPPVRTARVNTSPAPEPGRIEMPAPTRSQPSARSQGKNWKGWTAAGGTRVPLRNGDTLAGLSRRYGVPEQAIIATNGIEDPSQVRPGQNLIIPIYVYGGSPNGVASAPQALPSANSSDDIVTGSINPSRATSTGTSARSGSDFGMATAPRRKPRNQPSFAEISSAAVGGQVTATDASPIQVAVTPERKPSTYTATRSVGSTAHSGSDRPTSTPPAAAPSRSEPVVAAQPSQPVERQEIASVDRSEPAAQAAPPSGGQGFRWPVRGRVISGFGMKPGGTRNDGINLSVPEGTPVTAAEDGTVIYSGNELKGYGNLVLLRHENGWVSAYAHNSKLKVKRGDKVRRGETVGEAGATGSVSQPQVHFELRRGNKPVDPTLYLPKG
ncbi:peptidoglycan DD-metalloendopeptidase family protein [Roseibium sp.]|uniref:peptidoglycan DD-metalloendopeptidase family protein n=1 Tax=Roseibium sp. TaxID=1936156 RepID=UPI003A968B8E